MFKQGSEPSSESPSAETIIGPSVKVEGDLNAVGNVIVEGFVNGKLSSDKDITIGSEAEVTADIKANNATIAGVVKGTISVTGHLTLESTAKISGDIKTGTISVKNGAEMNGQLSMGATPAPASSPSFSEKPDKESSKAAMSV